MRATSPNLSGYIPNGFCNGLRITLSNGYKPLKITSIFTGLALVIAFMLIKPLKKILKKSTPK